MLSIKESMSTKEVAHSINKNTSTTRRLMKHLVTKGYVLQKINPHDHRTFSYIVASGNHR